MKPQERFAELWTDYLEGDLNESGMLELRELLTTDESPLRLAADLYQTHRLLGLVAAEDATRHDEFIRDTLDRLPVAKDSFVSGVMSEATDLRREPMVNSTRKVSVVLSLKAWAAIAATIVGILCFSFWPEGRLLIVKGGAKDDVEQASETTPEGNVRLASLAHARFFGELSPPVNSILDTKRDYVLTDGQVEVMFPVGASAIIEAPAVFRVLSDASLGLDVGRCSVHAPDGAEGFLVETPVTRIVDRGTRFTVRVSETSETEVQVVEGAADIYRRSNGQRKLSLGQSNENATDAAFELRLTDREARRFLNNGDFTNQPARFNPESYRNRLSDRVVSFEATSAADGGAEHLTSVTVQRDGQMIRYPADRLISAELTWFKSTESPDQHGHLVGGPSLAEFRKEALSDSALNTGVINPGGSLLPLASDPVMETTEDAGNPNTPGFAVRFRVPVKNGPGPDVVFFELQAVLNPPDGDPFHVSPLKFDARLKSFTINAYDLTLASPESLKLAGFNIYRFDQTVASLAELRTAKCVRLPVRLNFQALAVGIDLSDLGYAAGEEVDGLFFQDANDDEQLVDPVFIGGLP